MRYRLIPQLNRTDKKPKILGEGDLECTSNEAMFFSPDGSSGQNLIGRLYRVKLESITKHGITVSGFEKHGIDKRGIPIYQYCEWYCPFVEE